MKIGLTLLATSLALVPLQACTSEPSAAESEQEVSLASFTTLQLKEHVGKFCLVDVDYLQLEIGGMQTSAKTAINKVLKPNARTLLGNADCDVPDPNVLVPNISIFGAYHVDTYRDGILSVTGTLEERRASGKTFHSVSNVLETDTGKVLRFNSVLDNVGISSAVEACKERLAGRKEAEKCSDTTNFGLLSLGKRSSLTFGLRGVPYDDGREKTLVVVTWDKVGEAHVTHPLLRAFAHRDTECAQGLLDGCLGGH